MNTNWRITGTFLLLITGLPAMASGQTQRSKRAEVKDVNVVNSPNVNVTNTPSVNVANTAAVTVSNTPSVNVANVPSVNVANAPSITVISQPFTVTSAVSSATPFTLTLPSMTPDGKAIKTVVIEFVTADCNALPGINALGAARVQVVFSSGTSRSFPIYALPFGAPMSFVNATEFVSAQKTLIFADPGSILSFGLSAEPPTCSVVFSGHLE